MTLASAAGAPDHEGGALRDPPHDTACTTLPVGPVVLCSALWIMVGLFGHEPYKPDEAYTVGLVKSIVDSGDWVVPHLVGEPFVEKPPLFFDVAALFAKALPVLPLHEAARGAVVLFVAIGLLAIAACARAIHGPGRGRLAVLLTLATLGTVVHLHQSITDTALFAGVAVGLLGLVRAPDRPDLGGLLLGAGLAISFLAKGLLGPGLLLCTGLGLLFLRPWRRAAVRTAALAAAVALPLAACWLVPLASRAPDQFRVWLFDNNLGRFLGWNDLGPKVDRLFYLRTLLWFALPSWPLALLGAAAALRDALHHAPARAARLREVPPLLFLLVGVVVLTLASDGRELYALVLVPAWSVAATAGLLRLPLRTERRIAAGVAALLLALAAVLSGAALVAMRVPRWTTALPAGLALPEVIRPSAAALVAFGLVALAIASMAARLRRPLRGALPLAGAAGTLLVWASLVLPWGGCLDALKGYRSLARSVAAHLPEADCVAGIGLGEGERALFDYFIGLRTVRVDSTSASTCDVLLVQSPAGSADRLDPSWHRLWEGGRAGADTSVFRLYARPAAGAAAGPAAMRPTSSADAAALSSRPSRPPLSL
jgi:4-amino-4-deoxy-L-arabinose transferase-like glycosyltransferase